MGDGLLERKCKVEQTSLLIDEVIVCCCCCFFNLTSYFSMIKKINTRYKV